MKRASSPPGIRQANEPEIDEREANKVNAAVSTVPSLPAAFDREYDFVAQRQQAIRLGQAGMLLLILSAMATFLVVAQDRLSAARITILLTTAVGFAAWALWGTRRVHEYFRRGYRAEEAPTQLLGPSRWGTLIHFGGLYSLTLVLYGVAVDIGELRFLWLFLLVPVGHAALFLPKWAAALALLASSCILVWAVHSVYGSSATLISWMQFSLAAVFVFVLAQIAVSAEKGRAEVARLVGELTAMNRQLSQYSIQAEELAVTRERNELARNIHDSVGHVLTAVNIQLRAAQALIHQDLPSANEAISRAQELSVSGLKDIRSSVSALRASPLDGKSLQDAIRDLLSGDSNFGCETTFEIQGEPRPLPQAVALALYRAAQEGITNVRKHTQATRVDVGLDFRSDATVCLSVTDDGNGAETLGGGFGLVGLRERAELLGGGLTVDSIPGGGVALKMTLPG